MYIPYFYLFFFIIIIAHALLGLDIKIIYAFRELMELIRRQIKCISQSLPMEGTARNIMRHILKIIREEFEVASKVSIFLKPILIFAKTMIPNLKTISL